MADEASPFRLEGRTAVVTGGNGGIGRATAVGPAGAGANVVVAARTVSTNGEVVKTITDAGGKRDRGDL